MPRGGAVAIDCVSVEANAVFAALVGDVGGLFCGGLFVAVFVCHCDSEGYSAGVVYFLGCFLQYLVGIFVIVALRGMGYLRRQGGCAEEQQ